MQPGNLFSKSIREVAKTPTNVEKTLHRRRQFIETKSISESVSQLFLLSIPSKTFISLSNHH